MIEITSKADLNRALANALHPEPPASERRAIHESGVWWWVAASKDWPKARHADDCIPFAGHWEPADFCGDPVASKLLRDRMRERGWWWEAGMLRGGKVLASFTNRILDRGDGDDNEECVAFALAALRALGVEFRLVEGWDAR